jgi:two-component system chemotaxis response regulator CheY
MLSAPCDDAACGTERLMSLYRRPALVVDDSPVMGRIVASCLRNIGFKSVDTVSSGAAALERLRSNTYGIVVSDYVMQPMTGTALRAAMDASSNLRMTPFLLITTQPPDSPYANLFPDLCDYALKPFTVETLKEKIDRLLIASVELQARGAIATV